MTAKRPIVLALLCILSWSFIPVVSRAGQMTVDNIQFLFWSNIFSAVAVGLTINIKQHSIRYLIKRTHIPFTAVLGFLGCFFYYLCLYYGYAQANAIEVLIVQYTWPAITAVLATLILNERLTVFRILSILCGISAAILVITKGRIDQVDLSQGKALLIVFMGAACFALFSVLSKKENRYDVSFTVFMYFLWASLFSFIALLFFSKLAWPGFTSLLIIIINGALINGLSYILWINALAGTEASRIAPLVYLSPVLSVIWLTLFFNEPFTSVYCFAIILSIISGLLITRQDKNTNEFDRSQPE